MKERQQLADLVGKNLTYISQLEGLDVPLYKVSLTITLFSTIISDIEAQQWMQIFAGLTVPFSH